MKNEPSQQLRAIAEQTAEKIRKRRRIEGWHEDESQFPKCDFEDIVQMLELAYRLGSESSKAQDK